MDRLTKLAAFKSKAKHQWKEEWDDAQRRIVTKLMSRAHPAFKKDERRWTSIQWAVNNPPLTEEEQKEKDKRDAIRKKRAECLAGDAREQKKAPPDPGPEPTAEERGVPQRTCEEIWAQIPLCHALKMGGAEPVLSAEVDETARKRARMLLDPYPMLENKARSQAARREHRVIDEAFNYAEVDAEWLVHALQKLKNIHGQMQFSGGVFYDLGSGVGRTAFVAALFHPFERVGGVEYLATLTERAKGIEVLWKSKVQDELTEAERNAREGLAFEFLTGDFFDAGDDWLSATLLFVDCTCFRPKVMRRFCAMAEGLVDGAVVVSLTRSVAAGSDEFFELWQEQAKVSWGETRAFVCERKPPDARRSRDRRSGDDGGGAGSEEPPTPTGPPALNAGKNVLLSSPMVRPATTGLTPDVGMGL